MADIEDESGTGIQDESGAPIEDESGPIARTLSGALGVIGRISSYDAVLKRLTDASVSLTGSVSRQIAKTYSGALTFTSWLSAVAVPGSPPDFIRAIDGALSFAGALAQRIAKTYTGALTFTSWLSAVAVPGSPPDFIREIDGALSFAGSIRIWLAGGAIPGQVSFAGVVSAHINASRALSRDLTFQGAMGRPPYRDDILYYGVPNP